MSSVSKRKKEGSRGKIKTMGDHKEFLKRITKTLYYGQLPALPCLSLPVTEVACSVWSAAQRGRSLRRLRADAASAAARAACVSPCALVLALLYVERLQRCNPDYLAAADPQELFLVSLMVSNKFLQDDGEDDEVICSEWATSGGLQLHQLKKLELDFLNAIEWKVFVSARSFAAGLARLERRVALRQARARGWFTYADLLAAAPALTTAALASLAAAAALLASALFVAHLPAPHPTRHDRLAPADPTSPDVSSPADLPPSLHDPPTPDFTSPADLPPSFRDPYSLSLDLPPSLRTHPAHVDNSTAHLDTRVLHRLSDPPCCRGWQWHVYSEERQNRSRREEHSQGAWWAAEWHRGALADPLRRWLDALVRYSERCAGGRGLRGWLGIYAAAVSDR